MNSGYLMEIVIYADEKNIVQSLVKQVKQRLKETMFIEVIFLGITGKAKEDMRKVSANKDAK